MKNHTSVLIWSAAISAGVFVSALGQLFAQVPIADTRSLAQYDKNQNGRLDPDEIVARDAAEAKSITVAVAPAAAETIVLSPFEVSAAADRG